MPRWPERVEIREVGPRDGLQNEAPVAVADRVRLIDALSGTGLARIEAAAFVSPAAIPPMAGSEAVMAAIERRPGVSYSALVPNAKGAERAIAAEADELELVVSASETHNREECAAHGCGVAHRRTRCRRARARGGHRGRSDRLHRIRVPLRRRRRARARRAAGRPPGRRRSGPALVRRHDRHGHAAARRTTSSTRSSAQESAPSASACTSTTHAAPRWPTSSPVSSGE